MSALDKAWQDSVNQRLAQLEAFTKTSDEMSELTADALIKLRDRMRVLDSKLEAIVAALAGPSSIPPKPEGV